MQQRDRGGGVPLAARGRAAASASIVGVNRFARRSRRATSSCTASTPRSSARQLERTRARPRRARRRPPSRPRARGGAPGRRRGTENLLPPMREALRARGTVGEICGALRDEFGHVRRAVIGPMRRRGRAYPSAMSRRGRRGGRARCVARRGRPGRAALGGGERHGGGLRRPSFARDVAPIVRETCTGCHQLGGIAPFAFRDGEATSQSRAAAIVGARSRRSRMPPWPPRPAFARLRRQETRAR